VSQTPKKKNPRKKWSKIREAKEIEATRKGTKDFFSGASGRSGQIIEKKIPTISGWPRGKAKSRGDIAGRRRPLLSGRQEGDFQVHREGATWAFAAAGRRNDLQQRARHYTPALLQMSPQKRKRQEAKKLPMQPRGTVRRRDKKGTAAGCGAQGWVDEKKWKASGTEKKKKEEKRMKLESGRNCLAGCSRFRKPTEEGATDTRRD